MPATKLMPFRYKRMSLGVLGALGESILDEAVYECIVADSSASSVTTGNCTNADITAWVETMCMSICCL